MKSLEMNRLAEIYTGISRPHLEQLAQVIVPEARTIADVFYGEMLAIPETHVFLSNELVDKRLRQAMTDWIKSLFSPRREAEVVAHIKRQREVGNVHARINIPMNLVNHGVRILKRECCQRLIQVSLSKADIVEMILLINELLDYSASLINESYITDMVVNERNAQSLRMNAIGQSLAIECERLRSQLFDWLRKILTTLYQGHAEDIRQLPSLYTSDFGLWVMYKADLIFSDYQEVVENLKKQLRQIEENLQQAISLWTADISKEFSLTVIELNDHVIHAAWLLSSFVGHALEMENVRDPLTHLFNRRYIPTIMQYAIRVHSRHDINFAVLMFDIDHFKKINDTYGHEAGDTILTQLGELLATNVRAGDFVFRYGGEEFLILLNGVTLEIARTIAEKLRLMIEQYSFTVSQSQTLCLTASIGIALHNGHPDYSRIISRADEALYQAKASGRNTVVIAP